MLAGYDLFAGLTSTYRVCKISWLSLDFLGTAMAETGTASLG
jgi:hypothetical protein